jgi:transposase
VARDYRPWNLDQGYLIPPDIREWLDDEHVAWTVIDAVHEMDTSAFHRARPGRKSKTSTAGKRGYNPDSLLALMIYAYAVGERSSRRIERLCWTDVAFRVLCGNDIPDHTVIARFRQRHDKAFEDLFTQVLVLCTKLGMGQFGVLAIDGTKIGADASLGANRSEAALQKMAREAIDDAYDIDRAEEAADRHRDNNPMPPSMRGHDRRAATVAKLVAEIAAEKAAEVAGPPKPSTTGSAQQRVDRAQTNLDRLTTAAQRKTQEWQERVDAGNTHPGPKPKPVEENMTIANAAGVLDRAQAALVRRSTPISAGGTGKEYHRNLTDPDSRIMKTRTGFGQCYNAQTAVTEDYLIVAVQVSSDGVDMHQYQPMVTAAEAMIETLNATHGSTHQIGTVLADAGYCSTDNLTAPGPDRVIATGSRRTLTTKSGTEPPPLPEGATPIEAMAHRLRTPEGRALYKRRGAIVEPVNAHLKDQRRLRRMTRRGLEAAKAELHLAAAVTNLLRLRTAGLAAAI